MKKNKSVINQITYKLLLPYIICFGFYIQLFGELAPGGGFQAGAIIASSMIGYDISIKKIIYPGFNLLLLKLGALGVLIYLLTGLCSLAGGMDFLNYNIFSEINGQSIGIMIVELGVGIGVFAIMLFLYMEFRIVK